MGGPTLVGWIRGLGYQRVIARSDIEPGIVALLSDVSIAVLDVEIVETASPQEDHHQHGLAEASVREVEGQARVPKSDLEAGWKRRLQGLRTHLGMVGATCCNTSSIGDALVQMAGP